MSCTEQGKDSPVCPHHKHEAVEADSSTSEDTKQVTNTTETWSATEPVEAVRLEAVCVS